MSEQMASQIGLAFAQKTICEIRGLFSAHPYEIMQKRTVERLTSGEKTP